MNDSNVKSDSFWVRTGYMVMFGLIYGIADIFVFGTAILQWGHSLFTGQSNKRLSDFASSLSQYLQSIVAFLGFSSEEKPFPFADWPKPKTRDSE